MPTEYDLIEYPSKPFAQCQPDRLAVIGRLFGLHPAPVNRARVLEIGCGDGLNLIASAIVLPGAEFYGVDLSATAIARGAEMVRELGLPNVFLEQRDLRSLSGTTPGGAARKFHFLVAHGLYSWVPADVRDALLGSIGALLDENGIAFISYNVYPGAYLRQMVREMARIAGGGQISVAREWLAEARELSTGPPVFRAVVRDEAEDMLAREEGALFHDDLSEINQPVWFGDFVQHAAQHGLQYIAEVDLGAAGPPCNADRIKLEQHSDFLLGRRFRQSLLCHAGQMVRPEHEPAALKACLIGGPVDPGTARSDGKFEYVSRVGGRFRTGDIEDRLILESLAGAWPRYLEADEFGEESYARILKLFAASMIDIRTVCPPVADEVGARPEASALARLQAEHGNSVTTLHHMEVVISSESLRSVLCLADGARTRKQLARNLKKFYPEADIEAHLEELRQYGLLVAPQ